MSRRSLIRAVLAAAHIALIPSAAAAATAGSSTAATWTWVALPGIGLQVHCTAPAGRATVPVRWTAEGAVTASFPVALTTTPGCVTMAAGYGLTVRRVA